MTDQAFIKCLNKLKNTEGLTVESSNKIIEEAFPDLEFDSKTLLREITSYKMLDLKKTKFTEVFKLIVEVYPMLYKNVSTLDNYYTKDVRKIIHLRFPHVDGIQSNEYAKAKALVRLPIEVKGELLMTQKAKSDKKAETIIDVELSYITNLIKDNITSEDPLRRAFALLLASGCRPIELFHLSSFKALDDHWVEQDKVAKKKGRIVGVIKPIVYLTSTQFIAEVKRMRIDTLKRFPVLFTTKATTVLVKGESITKSEDSLSGSVENAANIIAKQAFVGGPEKDMTLYQAKSLYGAASHYVFGLQENRFGPSLSYARWSEKIFGHETALHNYAHYRIKIHTMTPPGLVAKVDIQQEKIDNIEERLKDLNVQQAPIPAPELSDKISPKIKAQFLKIKELYQPSITQTQMESIASKVAPRSVIRLFYKLKV